MATLDEDWIIFDTYLSNSDNKDIIINNSYLSIDIGSTKSNNIFDVLKEGVSQLKINNDGILIIKQNTSFPDVVENSIIYNNNDFYVSF